jgi:hypothetical protein
MDWLCNQLGVARNGFYAWRQPQQTPGPRVPDNEVITAQMEAVFELNSGFYGAPRIHRELLSAGLKVGHVLLLGRRGGEKLVLHPETQTGSRRRGKDPDIFSTASRPFGDLD